MSEKKHLALSPYTALVTDENGTRFMTTEGRWDLSLDKLGDIAEWLAVAWENLAGEQYQPVIISERGYVKQAGVVTFATAIEDLERDCE